MMGSHEVNKRHHRKMFTMKSDRIRNVNSAAFMKCVCRVTSSPTRYPLRTCIGVPKTVVMSSASNATTISSDELCSILNKRSTARSNVIILHRYDTMVHT